MSQRNQSQAAVVGNTARVLEAPKSWDEPVRRRTPLVVVAPVPKRQRLPFAVFCSVVLIAALAAVMLINISVSKGQYELVRLSNLETTLEQRNQALAQQAENLRAPQHLAAEAAQLGMVASSSFGYVDLNELKVLGDPKPADKDDEPLVSIPPAETGVMVPGGAGTSPEESASEGSDAVAETPSGEDAAEAPAVQNPAPSEAELNGGTVPAPKQKSGQ